MLQLRNHIPIGGPARREPADGTESELRVSLGFVPGWYHERCGVDLSERWHKDPYYRYQCLVKMKKELCRSFPEVPYWREDYTEDLATLSGCYGAYVIPQLFGFSLQYAPDRWPVPAKDNRRLSRDEIARLKVDELLNSRFVEELFQQMDIIESEWGKIHGYLNWQGILNTAFTLRGEQIFLDMYQDPELVHDFFPIICEVTMRLAAMVQERQRHSGFYINQFSVSNCTINMIGPRAYREFVFPYDRKIALGFERFGVHTCNWDATPYLEELRKLPNMGYLDMGLDSDLKQAKALFPATRRAVLYSPVRLEQASLAELRADMTRIHNDFAPCDVVVADIEKTTPDSRVRELLAICRELADSPRG